MIGKTLNDFQRSLALCGVAEANFVGNGQLPNPFRRNRNRARMTAAKLHMARSNRFTAFIFVAAKVQNRRSFCKCPQSNFGTGQIKQNAARKTRFSRCCAQCFGDVNPVCRRAHAAVYPCAVHASSQNRLRPFLRHILRGRTRHHHQDVPIGRMVSQKLLRMLVKQLFRHIKAWCFQHGRQGTQRSAMGVLDRDGIRDPMRHLLQGA